MRSSLPIALRELQEKNTSIFVADPSVADMALHRQMDFYLIVWLEYLDHAPDRQPGSPENTLDHQDAPLFLTSSLYIKGSLLKVKTLLRLAQAWTQKP